MINSHESLSDERGAIRRRRGRPDIVCGLMNDLMSRLVKELQIRSPLRRYFFHRYQYMFNPAQLCFLCGCVERTATIDGAIVEIGCALGHTTVFLNKHVDALKVEKQYFAIDTFGGFTPEDVRVELDERGKSGESLDAFAVNSKRWFDYTMSLNDVRRVTSIEADANTFDYDRVGRVAFCLVDVDLYRPVKKVLEQIIPRMSPGGIVVIDDCSTQAVAWDGALHAYEEFVRERGLPSRIVHGKLGVIEVPAA
jgi:O-methyltransferase